MGGIERLSSYKGGLKRKDYLMPCLDILYSFVKTALGVNHINVHGMENLPNGPALILPKHRYDADIPVEFYFLRRAGIYANYVMRPLFPERILVHLGGVKIIRAKDMRKIINSGRRNNGYLIGRLLQENQNSLEYIKWLYGQGEFVVSHPEGSIYPDSVGHITVDSVIRATVDAQRHVKRILIVPVGTIYDREPKILHPANVIVQIGQPISIEDFVYSSNVDEKGLVGKIGEEIAKLSGFPISSTAMRSN